MVLGSKFTSVILIMIVFVLLTHILSCKAGVKRKCRFKKNRSLCSDIVPKKYNNCPGIQGKCASIGGKCKIHDVPSRSKSGRTRKLCVCDLERVVREVPWGL